MATEPKSPVDIVEAFLAMQNTRKEAAERFAWPKDDVVADKLDKTKASAEKAIAQLMDELSQFGDAAKGAGSEENEVNRIWNGAAANLEDMSTQQKQQTLQRIENALQEQYAKTLAEQKDLPLSIQEALEAQAKDLASNSNHSI
jgi:putative protein kinase ArgK-like GTPase of G3E family